ncbi:GH19575 [Drosophila grimshawi]|uniref:Molybdopterin synthase catalytic subunit n=1 Tax=Drosophila grimshawi TaxID=7222 RepID=MOC2B_DROGR|nr:RecName: Full=Molybdopterin synthase catalytic subunit; AltName: Full=Molybdenum cofactor synthesis protein 2 large subunit; AltName: Full=Molybdenum cofactor synthesis protein 2B; Short=MOCS2B [Drosophila grimshawi]EDV93883.1 GH19575 [Drosophila grimshawi]
MDHIQLVNSQIDINHIHNLLIDESCGASSVFVGTTRDNFDGKKVISLEYESYEKMALKEMSKICSQLRARWPDLKHIAIYHRLGTVPVKEASVVIATSAPHRAAALESVTFAVEQLKSRVPIWKKEIYENDTIGEWKENMECPWPQYSKASLRTFDFSSCKIKQTIENIPDKLVQIRVNDSDLNKRVKCFLKRKRDEINLHNINDFKQQSSQIPCEETTTFSCARTQSFLVKQQQSSGHLKVRRANNCCGPQVRPNYSLQLNKLMTPQSDCDDLIEYKLGNSRLRNIEAYMCVSPDDDNILNRIKNIEDRILLIESTSPEYKHFVQFGTDSEKTCLKKPKKEVYLTDRINEFLTKIKREIEQ